MGEVDISQFNAKTLQYLASLAIPIEKDPVLSYTDPKEQANERGVPILSTWFVNDRMNRSELIVGIKVPPIMLPCQLCGLSVPPIEINQPEIIFETPIFSEVLDECGYTPHIKTKSRSKKTPEFLIVTLPDSLIEECGSWWKFVNSSEEFTIIPGALKIKYNIVNIMEIVHE
uniref:Uncharacterized protein n=1 Tax=Marseillevirus LCMAC101 TaxID=2506602 RepID=A0A481YQF1_9VIRU|nr:MAG: hypothetical protein LCMAC101_00180 [Marseillevirus LCMAC101]